MLKGILIKDLKLMNSLDLPVQMSPNRVTVCVAMVSRSKSGYGMNRQDEINMDYKDESLEI
jgi:hypothetical protein